MINRRKLAAELTEGMAQVLHYQERGEPQFETAEEYRRLPQEIIERYRNDLRFHAQVSRAVAMVIRCVDGAVERDADQLGAV